MINFVIVDAVKSLDHKPRLPYHTIYMNEYEFEDDSIEDAVDFIYSLQSMHDLSYGVFNISEEDKTNAPKYMDCLYILDENDTLQKVDKEKYNANCN